MPHALMAKRVEVIGPLVPYHNEMRVRHHVRLLLQENPKDGDWLITEIVQRATGVFLWVILVVKSLIHGLRCGDGIQHLQ
jgi:hypothetical protein